MSLKYCDKHCCYCNIMGLCEKCARGEPGYIRKRGEVNPRDKARIADLEKRGLIAKKSREVLETKEVRSIRLEKRKKGLEELDRIHKIKIKLIKENDWDGLAIFEKELIAGEAI